MPSEQIVEERGAYLVHTYLNTVSEIRGVGFAVGAAVVGGELGRRVDNGVG